jgi:hypothetical protein
MIQLVELVETSVTTNPRDKYVLREIYLNPEHIIMVREDRNTQRAIHESKLDYPEIPANMKFTKLTINKGSIGQDVTVLGSVEMIYEKIESFKVKNKQILRG